MNLCLIITIDCECFALLITIDDRNGLCIMYICRARELLKHCHNQITGQGGLREQMRIKPYANKYVLTVQWSDRCRRVVRHGGRDRIHG